jgi:hypothetical protein
LYGKSIAAAAATSAHAKMTRRRPERREIALPREPHQQTWKQRLMKKRNETTVIHATARLRTQVMRGDGKHNGAGSRNGADDYYLVADAPQGQKQQQWW